MKKIVMTMVTLLAMTAAVAQTSDNQQQRQRREFKKPTPEEMTNRMAENLKLDDKQKAKVLELNKEYESVLAGPGRGRGFGGPRGQRVPRPDAQSGATQQQPQQAQDDNQQQQRRQRPELTDEQKAQMKQMREKRQEYDKKLKEVLTDEQYQTYQKQQQRRGFGGPRGQRQN